MNVPPLTKTDLELASALRVSVTRLARRLRYQRSDTPLSIGQIAVLATLDRHGPLTPRSLAEHEKVQPPSMTRTLAGLEELGLVERAAHPTDRRQVLLALTGTATAILKEERRRREAWLAQRLAELTAEERLALRAAAPVLERLARS
ncbi:MAG: MarR family winged helix-turn-helix transcriptional regulator [Carbonactinosporaceae bacterium]